MDQKIALVGMMGAGKSSVGRTLSELLTIPFVDLDAEIEQRFGSIPGLFEKGEDYFRQCESETIQEVLSRDCSSVLALGGGAFLAPSNRKMLAQAGFRTAWLDCPGWLLWQRVQGSGRPLAVDRKDFLLRARIRRKVYRLADARIVAYPGSASAVAARIWDRIGPLSMRSASK